MKFSKVMLAGAFLALALTQTACMAKVGNGEVGVRYHTCGGERGVEDVALQMGYYFTGWCTDIENVQTFAQTRNWKEGEALHFADKDGLQITAEMGITYVVEPTKAPYLYKRYRRGIDEITDTFVHNIVRDTLIRESSQLSISEIMGNKKSYLLTAVQKDVIEKINSQGIIVQSVYWIGALDVPDSVRQSVNAKIVATQRAQQIENEVAQTRAQAEKNIAEAEGQAKAILLKKQAEAEGNKVIAASISPTLVDYLKVQRWNGQVPRVQSGSGGGMILNLKE